MGSLTRGGAQGPDPQDLETGALLVPPGHHWSRDDLEVRERRGFRADSLLTALGGLERRRTKEAKGGLWVFSESCFRVFFFNVIFGFPREK